MDIKVIEKVQKLLALGRNDGATDGERDNALRMAHGLLAKHNLSMLEVESYGAPEKRADLDYAGWNMPFSTTLAVSVSKLFFCQAYLGQKVNGTKQEFHFVGKVSNATTAQLMHEYLTNSILKECRKHWKHNLAPESRAFALGAASRILERVKELMETPLADAEPGTALTVVNLYKTEDAANSEFLASGGVSLVASKPKSLKAVKSSAYSAGRAYGDSVSLHGQIGSAAPAGRLG